MSVNILIGKSRHQSRSDREREKLQAQISTYALRHHSDLDLMQRAEELQASKDRLVGNEPVGPSEVRMDRVIHEFVTLVDAVLNRHGL